MLGCEFLIPPDDAARLGTWRDHMFLRHLLNFCLVMVMSLACATPMLAEDCSNEATLKSKPGGGATDITFHNGSNVQRRVYWIDETGQRRLKSIVEAGKSDNQPTIATHVWVVTGPKERCLYVIAASSAPLIVEIGGSGGKPVFAAPPAVDTRPAPTTVEKSPRRGHDCSRHETYDRRRGECVSKASRCSRHEVYSSSMAQCIPKAAMCEKNQVYSSSLARCIPKWKGNPAPPKPVKPVKPIKPSCKYKTDGAGNCLSPSFLICQKAYGACMKGCGGKSSCTAKCEKKYAGTCGN